MTQEPNLTWKKVLQSEFDAPYFQQLQDFVAHERQQHVCYPRQELVSYALRATPFDKVRVIILGQDPYHEEGQAMGLCFSVPHGIAVPPSLVNIIKEINSDIGTNIPTTSGDLTGWAQQGVLLLNATLTVRAHAAGSHQGRGWEQFTDAIISRLSEYHRGLVFLLWGSYAIKKNSLIDTSKHHILTAPHPSPLSAYRGFFGCRHFSRTNQILASLNIPAIDWTRIS